MAAYYNEVDSYAAQWLCNLIAAGEIAPGDVDERSIVDVQADDLRGYGQCHFFAGIGGWSAALRLAGWPDDRPVWTGSCPCQPFSAAGAGKAADDERHLWPAWASLIAECRPGTVFGEQVEAAIGWGWLDAVFADLEAEGYTCGAAVLPACGVGAPHIRNRLWFVADSTSPRRPAWPQRDAGKDGRAEAEPRRLRDAGLLADADAAGQRLIGRDGLLDGERAAQRHDTDRCGADGGMGDADGEREVSLGGVRQGPAAERRRAGPHGFWSDLVWLPCSDGKARPTGPGVFPLAHGVQRRPSKLRAYGNAIVPQVAAEFVAAVLEVRP